ncbi:MAG: hypothetical protein QUS14_04575 [Pyrinomonadaceae bacterium]|nr:hypothetical protein [Pyrinomonadaceae bacterium]
MEPEFDKVIDALLRSSPKGGADGGAFPVHPDADEISAFAENALPAAARSKYVAHFADCGRCRTLLAGVMTLNAEAPETAAAAAVTPVIEPVAMPWFKRLFTTPSLAAAMGVLVLVFSGFIGYIALRDQARESSTISQVRQEAPAARGPMVAEEQAFSANTAANANAAVSNAAANTMPSALNTAANTTVTGVGRSSGVASAANRSFSVDGAERDDLLKMSPAAPPSDVRPVSGGAPPPPAPAVAASEAVRDEENKKAVAADTMVVVTENQAQTQIQNQTLPNARSGPVQVAPGQRSDAAKKRSAAPSGTATRAVEGKSFDRRDGVWYDQAYDGRPIRVIRRGSDAYKELDSGLRAIAENLSGTIVVVWKDSAYRIQ